MKIDIKNEASSFAQDKDIAQELREERIRPALKRNEEVILDFMDIDGATQSFIHALISDLIRKEGEEVLDKIAFKNCNPTVKKIIEVVVAYMQEA